MLAMLGMANVGIAATLTDIYPANVEKICKAEMAAVQKKETEGTEANKESEEATTKEATETTDNKEASVESSEMTVENCAVAQINFLKPVVQQTYEQALGKAKNKEKLEKEQAAFEKYIIDSNDTLQEAKKSEDKQEVLNLQFSVRDHLVSRLRDLYFSYLGLPTITKPSATVQRCFEKTLTNDSVQALIKCSEMELTAETKSMTNALNKALAKTKAKTKLRNDQKKWETMIGQLCFNIYAPDMDSRTEAIYCKSSWTRVRTGELNKMAKGK